MAVVTGAFTPLCF